MENEKKSYNKTEIIKILNDNFDNVTKLDLVSLARYTYKLININVKDAKKIYSYILNSYPTYNYRQQLRCLENMIIEKQEYLNFSTDLKKQYKFFSEQGRNEYKTSYLDKTYNYDMEAKSLYKKTKLEKAYDYYLAGLYVTNHNIFNYYLGKICYKAGYISEAEEYLDLYIKNGGEKFDKAMLYLNQIYKIKKNKTKFEKSICTLEELSKFFGDKFQYYHYSSYEDYIKSQGSKRKKLIKVFDEQSKTSSSVKEQLETIKNLILTHQEKKADKLLLELEKNQSTMSKDDKRAFLQFQKNKKLYRAKR